MKLFLAPGACSLSPHIALHEAGLNFEAVRVDFATKLTADGRDFIAINPKGYVPSLQLDNGYVLTEGPAILQFIADQAPGAHLAPPNGTLERYKLQEWLGFINSELHKVYGPLFNPKAQEESKTAARNNLLRRFGYVAQALDGKQWLMGEAFTVADCYLYVMLVWSKYTGVDLASMPVLAAYQARIDARPAVRAALVAENAMRTRK